MTEEEQAIKELKQMSKSELDNVDYTLKNGAVNVKIVIMVLK